MLGTPTDTIRAAEDRDIFKEKLEEIGEKMAPSIACNTLEEVPLTQSTQGSSWGYLKVNYSETLSSFGDKCPQNGSKNDLMAPITTLGYPH